MSSLNLYISVLIIISYEEDNEKQIGMRYNPGNYFAWQKPTVFRPCRYPYRAIEIQYVKDGKQKDCFVRRMHSEKDWNP